MLAVVTGASSGIGAAFARKLAARGFDLLLIARREDRLRSLAGEIASLYHVQVDVLPADLTDDVERGLIAERIRTAPSLGILVNNAGFGTNGYFFETGIRSQEQMHRLHVLNTMSLTHAAVGNLFQQAKPGTGVINVSSVAGFATSPHNVSYCATKAWMNAFTEGLALELADRNSPVQVQALCPGLTLTEFHDLLGMDRSKMPQSLWMTPDYVVEESLRGFARGELFVIPGWRYKAMVVFMNAIPRSWLRKLSVAVRKRRQRKN